ncbi:MAG: DoxX family protein [Flavobacteriales bacterium]|nr:DoxX family protein [Flavobacteriales bacterium]NUQ16400.1 DoxX family protein [Flavobacteriales bacterium]
MFAANSIAMLLNSEPVNEDFGLLLLRVASGGGMFWHHGLPKLMHFGERMENFSDPLGIGSAASLALIVFAEAICALLVLLGLWTRATVIPLLIAMGVVVFVVDAGEPLSERELGLFYLLAFSTLMFTGSGRFSIDRLKFQ